MIPALDAEATIEVALKSVLAAHDVDVEVLVVDDGSLDRTVEVVQEFGDPRVRLLSTAHRRSGAGAARNLALDAANGRWIALLDADDWWLAERLKRLLATAKAEDADFVADDIQMVRDGHATGSTLFGQRGLDVGDGMVLTTESLLRHDLGLLQPVVSRDVMVRGRVRYSERRRATEDFAFNFACVSAARQARLVPEPMYFYAKQSDGSTVSSATPQFWLDSHEVSSELLRSEAATSDATVRRLLVERSRRAVASYHYLSAREEFAGGHPLVAARRMTGNRGAIRIMINALRKRAPGSGT